MTASTVNFTAIQFFT